MQISDWEATARGMMAGGEAFDVERSSDGVVAQPHMGRVWSPVDEKISKKLSQFLRYELLPGSGFVPLRDVIQQSRKLSSYSKEAVYQAALHSSGSRGKRFALWENGFDHLCVMVRHEQGDGRHGRRQ